MESEGTDRFDNQIPGRCLGVNNTTMLGEMQVEYTKAVMQVLLLQHVHFLVLHITS